MGKFENNPNLVITKHEPRTPGAGGNFILHRSGARPDRNKIVINDDLVIEVLAIRGNQVSLCFHSLSGTFHQIDRGECFMKEREKRDELEHNS